MRMWAKKTGRAALVAAGVVAAGGGGLMAVPAGADVSSGSGSVLGGNQFSLPISAPINVSGNSAAAIGTAEAKSPGGAHVENVSGHADGHPGMRTSGDGSVLGGNQLRAPISVPINICGNSAAILGVAKAWCKGGAHVENHTGGGGGGMHTSGDGSVGGGNQFHVPISVPVNVCGNSAAILGVAKAWCKGGAHVLNQTTGAKMKSSGDHSVLGGNQFDVPVGVPVNVCANNLSLLGTVEDFCRGAATVTNSAIAELPSTLREPEAVPGPAKHHAAKPAKAKPAKVRKPKAKVRKTVHKSKVPFGKALLGKSHKLPNTERLSAARMRTAAPNPVLDAVGGLLGAIVPKSLSEGLNPLQPKQKPTSPHLQEGPGQGRPVTGGHGQETQGQSPAQGQGQEGSAGQGRPAQSSPTRANSAHKGRPARGNSAKGRTTRDADENPSWQKVAELLGAPKAEPGADPSTARPGLPLVTGVPLGIAGSQLLR